MVKIWSWSIVIMELLSWLRMFVTPKNGFTFFGVTNVSHGLSSYDFVCYYSVSDEQQYLDIVW